MKNVSPIISIQQPMNNGVGVYLFAANLILDLDLLEFDASIKFSSIGSMNDLIAFLSLVWHDNLLDLARITFLLLVMTSVSGS